MKITAIDPIVCSLPIRHRKGVPTLAGVPRKSVEILLVRLRTDEGLTGWGEVFGLFNMWPAARTALETLITPLCLGRDALARNTLTERVTQRLHGLGRSGAVLAAWSGVEMALWDIAGKSLGVPVHRLLGGAQVEQLGCYASLPRYGSEAPLVHDCEQALARGFEAVKIHEITELQIRAAASALGGAPLMVDANCPWSLDEALRITSQLRDIDLRWLEEPLYPADDYEALARLRHACNIPIAVGESVSAMADFDAMLRLEAVDFVQPSVAKLGGLAAMQRVFALAATSAVEVAPHSPFFGPALVANLHLCAALAPKGRIESYFLDLAGNPFEEVIRATQGVIALPQAPGLGCDPDPSRLRECTV